MAEEQVVGSPEREIHVDPLVHLEKVSVASLEEQEEEIYKMRAKLFRYHTDEKESLWKERGVGDIKIMKHKSNGTYRIVMRRDKTLKICANHALTGKMELKPHASSDKALIWTTPSDYTDGEPTPETLCVRFGKPESTTEFKEKFEECTKILNKSTNDKDSSEKLANDLSSLNVKDVNENTEKSTDSNEETSPKEPPVVTNGDKSDDSAATSAGDTVKNDKKEPAKD